MSEPGQQPVSSAGAGGPGAKQEETAASVEPQVRKRKAISLSSEEHERLLGAAKQAEHYKDQYLRAVAEFDNARKRLDREREEFIRFASERLVTQLLPIVDSFEQALKVIDELSAVPSGTGQAGSKDQPAPARATCGPGEPTVTRQPAPRSRLPDSPSGGQASWQAGVRLIFRQLMDLLEKEGVKRIEALGKPFDTNLHEAIQQVETNGVPEGTVIEQIRVGYRLHGKVIRPALVKVAKRTEK